MTPKISLVTLVLGVTLAFVPAAWGKGQAVGDAPDAFERAVLAREQVQRSPLDLRGLDAHDRGGLAVGAASSVATDADAFERAVVAGTRSETPAAGDSHDRVDPVGFSPTEPVASGREVEWPQIGVGVLFGVLLALGLGLAARLTRIRPLAH